MVDAAGTNKYTYQAGGLLYTEGGLWASDIVTNVYLNGMRTNLSLQQPTGAWTNKFAWDAAKRLTNIVSPAGSFTNEYSTGVAGASGYSSRLIKRLLLPNLSIITNNYDSVARQLGTWLKTSTGTALDSATYGYNSGNQRTTFTNAAGTYLQYTYDKIGQLKIADSSVNTEDRGYAYDAAWNLNYRTNNGTLGTFTVDNKNQLTSEPSWGTEYYDASGSVTQRFVGVKYYHNYTYDDENRLVQIDHYFSGSVQWSTAFTYDGLGRLRRRIETTLGNATSNTRYIYDGMRVIQERNAGNTPTVSYTRGLDLSGTLEGAGGIGGLLALSSGYSGGNWSTHNFYHADGNGNITYIVDSSQALAASYRYDPFGKTNSSSGTLADANVYRFSSKEVHANSGMYYYGYRFYDPDSQRWINRDPIEELGGLNLYACCGNYPIGFVDPLGQGFGNSPPPCYPYPDCTRPHGPFPDNTLKELLDDGSGYLSCWMKCMGLGPLVEKAAEEAHAGERLGGAYYHAKYPKKFTAWGRKSKVMVPKFAGRLNAALTLKTACEALHCADKCMAETSGADPEALNVPYVPPYSGGPVNGPVIPYL